MQKNFYIFMNIKNKLLNHNSKIFHMSQNL